MRDPIERLQWEHQVIMRQIADLRGAVRALAEQGDAALPATRPVLSATVRMIEVELLAHARREDEALFPALEREFGSEGTPTEEMRREHRAIHAEADRFRETLRQLNEVEHPAIVAGSERLRDLAAAGTDAGALRRTAAEIIRLLDDHFAKEEEILFPMAREILDPVALDAVATRMEELDAV